jgi:hypothetical protein
LKPSSDSDIKMEVWMPAAGWNGKFQAVGNGAFNGNINYAAMATALVRGYAVSSTDTGHTGGGASWALGHPEKVVDFGWRAVHEMTTASKTIIASHYDHGPTFDSNTFSTRTAWVARQRRQADSIPWVERPPDFTLEQHPVLFARAGTCWRGVQGSWIVPALHGARHGALWWRGRPQHVRHGERAGTVGRAGKGAGSGYRIACDERPRGQDAATLSISAGRGVQGDREHGPGGEFRLQGAMSDLRGKETNVT